MAAVNSSSGFMANMLSLLDDLKKIETEDRFGFDSPAFLITIILVYLLFVYKLGPSIMQTRQPYKLREFLLVYNVFQVASCVYLIHQIWLLAGWDTFNFNKCVLYEPNTPSRKAFDNLTYFTFWLKITEFADTVMFVLRKKQNQVTHLHVFHHSATITLIYLLMSYYRGNGALYPIVLNSGVHVIMYSYYCVANICGSETMRRLMFIKKSITIIQMIQFVCFLSQAAMMWTHCKIPLALTLYYSFVVCVFFYGFFNFYRKSYILSQKEKAAAKQS